LVSMICVREGYFVELDDVGVAQYFEDADLASDAFDVGLLDYFLFLEGFDCDFLVCGDVDAETYFSESALAYAFAWVRRGVPTR
jgi:hypothetical protein